MDGAALAARIRAEVAAEVAELGQLGLATVLVGDDPASQIYIRRKHEAAREAGIEPHDHHLPAETSEADLLALVARAERRRLGRRDPRPAARCPTTSTRAASCARSRRSRTSTASTPRAPASSTSTSRRSSRRRRSGIIALLDEYDVALEGARAVVIGRSTIVGKPAALLLLRANATVTICHSRTADLAAPRRRGGRPRRRGRAGRGRLGGNGQARRLRDRRRHEPDRGRAPRRRRPRRPPNGPR